MMMRGYMYCRVVAAKGVARAAREKMHKVHKPHNESTHMQGSFLNLEVPQRQPARTDHRDKIGADFGPVRPAGQRRSDTRHLNLCLSIKKSMS